MHGKKIIFDKEYLDNYRHGGFSNNPHEQEKIKKKIKEETLIDSNYRNPYYELNKTPLRVKLIK